MRIPGLFDRCDFVHFFLSFMQKQDSAIQSQSEIYCFPQYLYRIISNRVTENFRVPNRKSLIVRRLSKC